jgi:hypothetical protein
MDSQLLKTLIYFDIFKYPLSKDELICYSGIAEKDYNNAEEELVSLYKQGIINCHKGFYFFGEDLSLVDMRLENNARATKRIRIARKYSKIISFFPFVRGVFLSGSISKGSISKGDDIDYFIVTAPKRLWIARTMLVLFRRVFLLNSHRNFCINYFIDSESFEIASRNRFTATEIAFLIPMYNAKLHSEFLKSNEWIKSYYPTFLQESNLSFYHFPLIKSLTELLFSSIIGNKIEDYLFKKSKRIIETKFANIDAKEFALNFSIKRNELKYFPNKNGKDVIERFNERALSLRQQKGIEISLEI